MVDTSFDVGPVARKARNPLSEDERTAGAAAVERGTRGGDGRKEGTATQRPGGCRAACRPLP